MIAEIHAKLEALRVEPHPRGQLRYSADSEVLEAHSGGLTRASQALAAAKSTASRCAEYEQIHNGQQLRLAVVVNPVVGKRARFLLVVLAFGLSAREREIIAALRLYPKGLDEEQRWLGEPGLALATLIDRYGAAYEIEHGESSRFEPVIDFERQRFVRHDRVELPEVSEALGFDYNPEALTLLVVVRLKAGGGVKLFFPMMLRTDVYRADVGAASR